MKLHSGGVVKLTPMKKESVAQHVSLVSGSSCSVFVRLTIPPVCSLAELRQIVFAKVRGWVSSQADLFFVVSDGSTLKAGVSDAVSLFGGAVLYVFASRSLWEDCVSLQTGIDSGRVWWTPPVRHLRILLLSAEYQQLAWASFIQQAEYVQEFARKVNACANKCHGAMTYVEVEQISFLSLQRMQAIVERGERYDMIHIMSHAGPEGLMVQKSDNLTHMEAFEVAFGKALSKGFWDRLPGKEQKKRLTQEGECSLIALDTFRSFVFRVASKRGALVMLQGCETLNLGRHVQDLVSAVIATSEKVKTDHACRFAKHFYGVFAQRLIEAPDVCLKEVFSTSLALDLSNSFEPPYPVAFLAGSEALRGRQDFATLMFHEVRALYATGPAPDGEVGGLCLLSIASAAVVPLEALVSRPWSRIGISDSSGTLCSSMSWWWAEGMLWKEVPLVVLVRFSALVPRLKSSSVSWSNVFEEVIGSHDGLIVWFKKHANQVVWLVHDDAGTMQEVLETTLCPALFGSPALLSGGQGRVVIVSAPLPSHVLYDEMLKVQAPSTAMIFDYVHENPVHTLPVLAVSSSQWQGIWEKTRDNRDCARWASFSEQVVLGQGGGTVTTALLQFFMFYGETDDAGHVLVTRLALEFFQLWFGQDMAKSLVALEALASQEWFMGPVEERVDWLKSASGPQAGGFQYGEAHTLFGVKFSSQAPDFTLLTWSTAKEVTKELINHTDGAFFWNQKRYASLSEIVVEVQKRGATSVPACSWRGRTQKRVLPSTLPLDYARLVISEWNKSAGRRPTVLMEALLFCDFFYGYVSDKQLAQEYVKLNNPRAFCLRLSATKKGNLVVCFSCPGRTTATDPSFPCYFMFPVPVTESGQLIVPHMLGLPTRPMYESIEAFAGHLATLGFAKYGGLTSWGRLEMAPIELSNAEVPELLVRNALKSAGFASLNDTLVHELMTSL